MNRLNFGNLKQVVNHLLERDSLIGILVILFALPHDETNPFMIIGMILVGLTLIFGVGKDVRE